MKIYDELQLNQAGSKALIRNSEGLKEKIYHVIIYIFKIMITVAFCFGFVTLFSILFSNDNSIVGVVSLLCLLVFRNAHLTIDTKQSTILLASFFMVMAFMPKIANMFNPFIALLINVIAIAYLIIFGCNEPRMYNHSTLVLSYLLSYGYDVSGDIYIKRLWAMLFGAIIVCTIFYFKNSKKKYPETIKSVIKNIDFSSSKAHFQICQIICVPMVVFIVELLGINRSMWAGIAAMSVIIPIKDEMGKRVSGRVIGNIFGIIVFLALYFILPSNIYAFIGIIGGIGVGLSANYSYQAIFNTFGALAIASELYGLNNALILRLGTNIFGALFALLFCVIFYKLLQRNKTTY